jgi:hypothetical protein
MFPIVNPNLATCKLRFQACNAPALTVFFGFNQLRHAQISWVLISRCVRTFLFFSTILKSKKVQVFISFVNEYVVTFKEYVNAVIIQHRARA